MVEDRPDVRRYVTEPAWGLFWTPASEIPDDVRGLYDPSSVVVGHVLAGLAAKLRQTDHDDDVHFVAAAAPAVPLLLRAAADPAVHHRAAILRLAGEAGHRTHVRYETRADLLRVANPPSWYNTDNMRFPVGPTIEAARHALHLGTPLLLGLLADPDVAVRCAAAYALANATPVDAFPDAAGAVAAGLRARLAVEDESAARVSLVLAVVQVEAGAAIYESVPDSFIAVPDPPIEDTDATEWARGLWSSADGTDDLRLAGALAWLCSGSAPPPEALIDVVAACSGPAAERWLRLVPWYPGPFPASSGQDEGLVVWLSTLMDSAYAARARLVTALFRNADPGIVVSACRAAYRLAAETRSERDAMIGLLTQGLSHVDPEVRRTAARMLTRCGEVSDEVAERVAQRLGDPAAHAWAVLTLANRSDARAVAPLAALLAGGPVRLPAGLSADEADDALIEVAGLQGRRVRDRYGLLRADERLAPGLISGLGAYSEELMPGILRRLTVPGSLRLELIASLAAWGDAAVPAVPALVRLLSGDERLLVAETLGWIGPLATEALPALNALIGADADADLEGDRWGILRWARHRIAGGSLPEGITRWDLVEASGPDAGYEKLLRAATVAWSGSAGAAVALLRCTGDLAAALPVLVKVLGDDDVDPWSDGTWAPTGLWSAAETVAIVGCLGDIGPAAVAALPGLIRLRDHPQSPRYWRIAEDQRVRRVAARAVELISGRFDRRFDEALAGTPDVRNHVVDLLVLPNPAPEDVAWQDFVYESDEPEDDAWKLAEDWEVPRDRPDEIVDRLRGLHSTDADDVDAALGWLSSRLMHGETVVLAAPAVPFLVRAAADPAVWHRARILRLAAFAGRRPRERFADRDTFLQVTEPPDEMRWDVRGFPEPWTLEGVTQ